MLAPNQIRYSKFMLRRIGFRFRHESIALGLRNWSGEFAVMALIKAMKSRVAAHPVADWSGKIGPVLDGAIAIALVVVVLVASGLMAFGVIQ
jgi:type IV secretory pathway VirB2 component (pilin)